MFYMSGKGRNAVPSSLTVIAMLFMLIISPLAGCTIGNNASSNSPRSSATAPANSCKLVLNGQESTIPASQLYEKNGRLMMAARPAMESLGVQTCWDSVYKILYVVYQEHNASFYANSNYYTYDTIENVMDVSSEMVDGELVVPVDICFGALGADIDWDKANQTLSISLPPEPDTSALAGIARDDVAIKTQVSESPAIKSVLDAQCQAGVLPAMGGAIVWDDGRIELAVSGHRKIDDDTPVSSGDMWHMGSCTKAMTATMIAYLIEKGDLRWNLNMDEAFPQYRQYMDAEHATIDIDMLLSHTAGFPRDVDSSQFERDFTLGLDAASCRQLAARQAADVYLEYPPGQGYTYSNFGYIVAAAMAEQARKSKWEDLMTELVFKPLGIDEVSYAGTGTPGKIDQPWPHDMERQAARSNGPFGDPYAMFAGPCGYVHLSLESWGKFVIDQMRGIQGKPALLKPQSYHMLVNPSTANPEYAHGWMLQNGTDGEPVYGHSGSNGLNTCVVKMYPARGYAVLVTTNLGDFLYRTPENYPPVYNTCEETVSQIVNLAKSKAH